MINGISVINGINAISAISVIYFNETNKDIYMSNDKITNRLDELEIKINSLEEMLKNVLNNQIKILAIQQKTNDHVDFVESVYEAIKQPFYKAMTIVNGKSICPKTTCNDS